MTKFTLYAKIALLAAVVLVSLLGKPLYAETQATPPGTGKTLTGALLGKAQRLPTQAPSPDAGQMVFSAGPCP